MRRVSELILFPLSWFLLTSLYACTTAPTPRRSPSASGSVPVPPTATVADAVLDPQALELEAMLLLLADRRILEALVVDRALEADGAVRRRLALILGRIADPRGKLALAALLTDAKPAVRQAAAFALGRLPAGDEAIAKSLLRAVADADRETGVRAVESLARQGVTLATVGEALSVLAPNELLERLLPSLFRFAGTGVVPEVIPGVIPGVVHWAEIGLLEAAPHLRRAAAYGLAREPQAEGVPALRRLLADEDPWIAGWAARALGRVGERSDLARLMPLLARAEDGPVVQALRAAGALIARGAAAPDESWRLALGARLDDPRVGVRIAALEVAGGFLRDEAIGGVLVERVRRAETGRERELALIALAEGGDPHAEALVIDAASDPVPAMRMRAAEAAGFVGNGQLLATLAGDADVAVRTAALAVRLSIQPRAQMTAWAQAALADVDPGVRATVLDWAAEHPVVPVDVLVAATQMRDRLLVAKTAGVSALRARAEAQAGEREQAIGALERLALARDFAVRRAAREALTALGRSASGPGPATQRPVAIYRDVFTQTHDPRFVDLETNRGTLRVRLACGEAPMTCLSFLQLAAQGFYNDLAWHRVIPDFVAQGGDPRGDGQGGPGYQLRDEPNLIRYHRGVLGMARSGPDTAGSQFFIALSRQPHLDGDYTAFGEVIEGAEVLDLLVQGDRILRITEVISPAVRR